MGHLGELLHQRRTSLGLTLEDLQNRTKIRGKYLEAIERGDFEVIPGEVYLRGFIRSIAAELGIDPGEAMQAYYQDLGQAAKGSPEAGSSELPTAAASQRGPAVTSSTTSPRRSRVERRPARSFFPTAVVLGLLLVVAAGVWYWSTYLRAPEPPAGNPPVIDQPAPGTGANPAPDPAEPAVVVALQNPGQKDPNFTVKPGPLAVRMSAEGGRCWVGVTADGKYQQLTLDSAIPTRTALTVQANQQITIDAGNPLALRLVINDQDQGVLGGNNPRTITVKVAP